MKAVRQTAFWYCRHSMQNGMYENEWCVSIRQSVCPCTCLLEQRVMLGAIGGGATLLDFVVHIQ